MPIAADRSATPRGGGEDVRRPDASPRFVTALANAWYEQYLAEGKDKRAMSADTPFRGSDAGFCSYSLALTLLERAGLGEKSNPPTLSGVWRMNLGQMIHSGMEEYLPLAFPGATCEVVGVTVEGEASFHADVLIEQPNPEWEQGGNYDSPIPDTIKTLFELKSINGTGFKSATIGYRKGQDPEGPRTNAVLQAALAAEAFDCDEVVVGYLSMECIGDGIAKSNGLDDIGKFAAEWTFTREEYQPLVEAERARFRFIKATVDAGRMPQRTIPSLPQGAVITDPKSGAWAVQTSALQIVDVGTTWQCGYCDHQDSCIALHKVGR